MTRFTAVALATIESNSAVADATRQQEAVLLPRPFKAGLNSAVALRRRLKPCQDSGRFFVQSFSAFCFLLSAFCLLPSAYSSLITHHLIRTLPAHTSPSSTPSSHRFKVCVRSLVISVRLPQRHIVLTEPYCEAAPG